MSTQLAISVYLAARKCFDAGTTVQEAQYILDSVKQPAAEYYYLADINKAIEQLTYKRAV